MPYPWRSASAADERRLPCTAHSGSFAARARELLQVISLHLLASGAGFIAWQTPSPRTLRLPRDPQPFFSFLS
jgi:hypothetical protein